jgi:hypothetical protein
MSIEIRRFRNADKEQIFPLYEINFGKLPRQRLEHRWNWQFVDNPAYEAAGYDTGSRGWVAAKDGKLLAYIGAFPARVKVLDREFIVNFECDLIADPEARQRDPTMVMRLLQAVIDSGEYLLGGVDYSDQHAKLRAWLKHRAVGLAPHCHRPCQGGPRVREFAAKGGIAGLLAKRPIEWLADTVLTTGIRAFNKLKAPARDPNLRIVRINQAGEEFDHLWARLRSQYPITSVRDKTFVRWRFFEDPAFENVVFGAYAGTNELVGYVVVSKVRSDDGYLRGRVVDLLCDLDAPLTASTLLRAATEHLRTSGVRTISCRGMHPRLQPIVRQSFYHPSESSYRARQPALILWQGPPELASATYDANNWHYTFADGSGGFTP